MQQFKKSFQANLPYPEYFDFLYFLPPQENFICAVSIYFALFAKMLPSFEIEEKQMEIVNCLYTNSLSQRAQPLCEKKGVNEKNK